MKSFGLFSIEDGSCEIKKIFLPTPYPARTQPVPSPNPARVRTAIRLVGFFPIRIAQWVMSMHARTGNDDQYLHGLVTTASHYDSQFG